MESATDKNGTKIVQMNSLLARDLSRLFYFGSNFPSSIIAVETHLGKGTQYPALVSLMLSDFGAGVTPHSHRVHKACIW